MYYVCIYVGTMEQTNQQKEYVIKAKISKAGNSYHILIPKALVDCGVLRLGEEIPFIIRESEDKDALYEIVSHVPSVRVCGVIHELY